MKFSKLLLAFLFLSLIGCKDEKSKTSTTKKTDIVQHYICDNKCENSGGAMAGNCPTCKKPYTHNVQFHANDLLKTGPLNVKSNATQPDAKTPTTQTNNAPQPAQNASGVYHYTCANGCVGGAGTVTTCKSCGETLAHNAAYHN